MRNSLYSLEQALQQLQQSHNINQQLQSHAKKQNKHIQQLQTQIRSKDHKIQQLAQVYQININEMKQLVESRDAQILSMRQQLKLTDYHMIRLKILNEVQLAHRQQIESCKGESERMLAQINKLKEQLKVNEEKVRIYKEEKTRIYDQNDKKVQELNIEHSKQLTKLYIALQQQRVKSYQSEQRTLKLKDKYNQLQKKLNKENQISDDFQTVFQKERSLSNQNFVFQGLNGGGKAMIQKLQKKLQQKQQEISSLKDRHYKSTADLKQKINNLQKQVKDLNANTQNQGQLKQKIHEKDLEISELKHAQDRKIFRLNQQHESQLKRIKKQFQSHQSKTNNTLHQENIPHYSNSGRSITQNDLSSFRQLIKSLERANRDLQRENSDLKKKLQKAVVQQKTVQNVGKGKNAFRQKLEQANKQIVLLLRQKIQLKQKIEQLKRNLQNK